MLLRQLAPETSPETRLRDSVQLLDERLYILPLWPQGFGMAATRIGGKAIDAGDDLLHSSALQVRDELVKLPDVLFGDKEVAAAFHPHLAGELDRAQALAVRPRTHHSPIMDLVSAVEGEPERGSVQFAQGFEDLAPVWPGRQRNPGRRRRLKIVMPNLFEES